TPEVGQTLRAEYTFKANGAGTDASTFQWQWKDGETWKNAAAAGNTARTFTLPDSYAGYSVRVVVTPKGSSQPALAGVMQQSPEVVVTSRIVPSVNNVKHFLNGKECASMGYRSHRVSYNFQSNGGSGESGTEIKWEDKNGNIYYGGLLCENFWNGSGPVPKKVTVTPRNGDGIWGEPVEINL
ncbi:hypothetical protein M8R50_16580, partial [Enterobacter bugandensis]